MGWHCSCHEYGYTFLNRASADKLACVCALQMDRETWRENGLAPPMPGTGAEKHWAEVNKAVPFTKVIM